MKYETNSTRKIILLFSVFLVSFGAIMFLNSCTKKLDGEINANQKPIVYFVNIPPEGQQFSRNPVIHWVGTDRDGIISFYQYHVATASDLGAATPLDYAASLTEEEWVRLDVDPKGPDPQTSNVMSMSADLSDPVRTYVDQYVFVQAFDEEGLGSDVIFRLFSRNDNPPVTGVYGVAPSDLPFINSVTPGGIITGMKIRWYGDDPIDYPSDPPPFEFHWRLYGPYTDEDTAQIHALFFEEVYVTNNGMVFEVGDTVFSCDTFFVDTVFEEECDTLVVEAGMDETAYGHMENRFSVNDPSFVGSEFDLVAKESSGIDSLWTLASSDTLYDVFSNFNTDTAGQMEDTTVLMNFIFWVRARDDAKVPALVPAFREFQVINPRYERDIVVLDYTPLGHGSSSDLVNPPVKDSVFTPKAYWKGAIDDWAESFSDRYPELDTIIFDTTTVTEGLLELSQSSPDYFVVSPMPSGPPISELLKHKLMIMYNDNLKAPDMSRYQSVYKGIDAGINVWLTMRCPVAGGGFAQADLSIIPDFNYTWYFGVELTATSGWLCHLWEHPAKPTECVQKGYFQDFIGTIPLNPAEWPVVEVDTANLHNRYWWDKRWDLWDPVNPALPEVNWSQTAFGTEVIYLYKSLYGQSHPIDANHAFQGRPVAHRYATSLFRTVHFNFTPLAMEDENMQVVMNSVLDWLYDPTIGEVVAGASRYDDAPIKITVDKARENARLRNEYFDVINGSTETGIE